MHLHKASLKASRGGGQQNLHYKVEHKETRQSRNLQRKHKHIHEPWSSFQPESLAVALFI